MVGPLGVADFSISSLFCDSVSSCVCELISQGNGELSGKVVMSGRNVDVVSAVVLEDGGREGLEDGGREGLEDGGREGLEDGGREGFTLSPSPTVTSSLISQ